MIEKLPSIKEYVKEAQGDLQRLDAALWVDTRKKINEIIEAVNGHEEWLKFLENKVLEMFKRKQND